MKIYKNWHFPENEKHFIKYMEEMGSDTYQQKQRDASFKFLDKFRNAIDIGANVGLWARDMCSTFQHVILIEPYEPNIECLTKNLELFNNFEIFKVALSNKSGLKNLYFNRESVGESTLRKHSLSNFTEQIPVNVKTLDEYSFTEIDYIKIDVQFHELEVIEGAINTLTHNCPVLCIESARRNMNELRYVKKFVRILNDLGYKVVGEAGKELFFKK